MNNIGLILGEMNQVHAILFGIQGPFLGPSFAVINDNLVVLGAGDQGSAVGGKVHMVNRILVIPETKMFMSSGKVDDETSMIFFLSLPEHFSNPHGSDDIVHQLHLVNNVFFFDFIGTRA